MKPSVKPSQHLNVEFKARCRDLAAAEAILLTQQPRFVGEDHQIDTYFRVPHGRLKLREGTIECALIHYQRGDVAQAKQSHVTLYHPTGAPAHLREVLAESLGVCVVVEKRRAIYFVDNVKIHLDRVVGLGTFLEVEAIDDTGQRAVASLQAQCDHFRQLFRISDADFIATSYSDLLQAKQV